MSNLLTDCPTRDWAVVYILIEMAGRPATKMGGSGSPATGSDGSPNPPPKEAGVYRYNSTRQSSLYILDPLSFLSVQCNTLHGTEYKITLRHVCVCE